MGEHVERMQRIWGATAGEWERQRTVVADIAGPVTTWLVEHLDPRPGETVLELGAGPGTDSGFEVAARLGSAGRLVCSDIAAEMVEAARREGERRGLTNVEYRVVDAQTPDLPDAAFDAVLARWVYQLVPDPVAALTEARRVLRPGGRLASSGGPARTTTPSTSPW